MVIGSEPHRAVRVQTEPLATAIKAHGKVDARLLSRHSLPRRLPALLGQFVDPVIEGLFSLMLDIRGQFGVAARVIFRKHSHTESRKENRIPKGLVWLKREN